MTAVVSRKAWRRRFTATAVLLCGGLAAGVPALAEEESCPAWLDQEMTLLRGDRSRNLCEAYRGKPLLIVNTASYCGFTPQFKGLEAFFQRYRDQGLVVAGFPSDDFNQEADDAATTAEVCYANYGVTFDMYAPVHVRGDDAHPLFAGLAEQGDGAPQWNFYKYLVAADGRVLKTFGSRVTPDDPALIEAVEAALAEAQ
ncbi:MAG: glutathione peroxidase [Spongiibacteraceae bacterium]|jgi:glutathione peroxidase|nr:glutathione peroxidase [Spongiibacteraceae bacterium]